MYKLISTSLAIALTSVSIGWAGNLELEAMATEFLGSNTGLWVVGAFILALLASDDN